MRRIGDNSNFYVSLRLSVEPFNANTKVVFHITRSLILGLKSAELWEDCAQWLAANIRENIQSATMWHSNAVNWLIIGRFQTTYTKESTPIAEDRSMTCLIAGINTSQPSRPKRFSLGHFFARKSSNLVERMSRLKSTFFWAGVNSVTRGASKCFRTQSCCS